MAIENTETSFRIFLLTFWVWSSGGKSEELIEFQKVKALGKVYLATIDFDYPNCRNLAMGI